MWTETLARREAGDVSGYSTMNRVPGLPSKLTYTYAGVSALWNGGVCVKVVSEETAWEGLSLGYLHINAKQRG